MDELLDTGRFKLVYMDQGLIRKEKARLPGDCFTGSRRLLKKRQCRLFDVFFVSPEKQCLPFAGLISRYLGDWGGDLVNNSGLFEPDGQLGHIIVEV